MREVAPPVFLSAYLGVVSHTTVVARHVARLLQRSATFSGDWVSYRVQVEALALRSEALMDAIHNLCDYVLDWRAERGQSEYEFGVRVWLHEFDLRFPASAAPWPDDDVLKFSMVACFDAAYRRASGGEPPPALPPIWLEEAMTRAATCKQPPGLDS